MRIIERLISPTPPFFAKLRNIGLVLAAISGVVLTSPMALPATLITIATYVGLAAGVITAVSQLSVSDPATEAPTPLEYKEPEVSIYKEKQAALKNKMPTIMKLMHAFDTRQPIIKKAYGP